MEVREIADKHIVDWDDVNTWELDKFNASKCRLIGMRISIFIDKILTAGHKLPITYNSLGRQTRHMINEQEDEAQESHDENTAAQADG